MKNKPAGHGALALRFCSCLFKFSYEYCGMYPIKRYYVDTINDGSISN